MASRKRNLEKLEEALRALHSDGTPGVRAAVRTAHQNVTTLETAAGYRQELIEAQCRGEGFEGEAHERYHEACQALDTALDNLFTSLKTTLNRLATLAKKELPRGMGLKAGSYGAFIATASKAPLNKTVRNALFGGVTKIKAIADYRDTFHEHQSPKHSIAVESSRHGLRRVHYRTPETGDSPGEPGDNQGVPCVTTFIDHDEPDVYYIYVHTESDLREGDEVGPDHPFGVTSDCGGGHFDKHGSHTHLFTSPLAPPLDAATVYGTEVARASPDPVVAFDTVLRYCTSVARSLARSG